MSAAARRGVAIAALLIAAVIVALLLFGGGNPYTVKLRLQNASQLVKGDLVQVAGAKVGNVKSIRLTDDGQAEVKLTVSEDYAPLHTGTRAIVRQPSLSGVANRYIDLQQGPMTADAIPNGGLLPASSSEAAVDLHQIFNIFDPKTRKATRAVISGFADMTEGRTQ